MSMASPGAPWDGTEDDATNESASDLVTLWLELAGQGAQRRPDFRFDADFYRTLYADLAQADDATLAHHYEHFGRAEGRSGTLYSKTQREVADLDAALAELVREPRLKAALEAAIPDAAELAFELIALGDPVDKSIADFSAVHYRAVYPDLSGTSSSLFLHYIQFGVREGRRSLADLRRNFRQGRRAFDPAKPTCVVCAHDFSGTGAPIVARDLVASAADDWNVVVIALREGKLLESFVANAVAVMWTENPAEELDYLHNGYLNDISFAVFNSVECFPLIKYFVRRDIPFVSYIHEFSYYSLPYFKNVFTALYADRIVFSSETVRDSWGNIFNDAAFDIARDSAIVPQAALAPGRVPAEDYRAARAALSRLIGRDIGTRRVVYGAGHVQWRKGTDIFAMVAKQCRDAGSDTLFVWIGDGLNHEDIHIGVWMEKHLQDAGVNDPDGNLFYIPAGPYYHDVCRAADTLFLSSRLDPLPNVVFDAVAFGCGVVLFEGASGFDDSRYAQFGGMARVPFGNLAAAAQALESIPRKTFLEEGFAVPTMAEDQAEQPTKSIFEEMADDLKDCLATLPPAPESPGRYDVGLLYGPTDTPTLRAQDRRKIWRYGRRAIWRSREEAQDTIAASDNWIHRTLRIASYSNIVPIRPPRYAIHVHAYYIDEFEADLAAYMIYKHAARVVATTDTPEKAQRLMAYGAAAGVDVEAIVVPNRGRDILPFIELFTGEEDDDAIWCHVHLKKSIALGTSGGDVWRTFLTRILFGDAERMSSAIAMIRQPHVGLVSAFDPYIMGWTASHRLLPQIAARFPGPLPDHPLLFPVGNMFWTKAGVVNRMRGLFGPDYPWPNEPIANDGTVFHLIERLWPAAAAMSGFDSVFLDKADERRV